MPSQRLLILACAAALAACAPGGDVAQVGSPAPALRLTDLAGRSVSLRQHRGRVVLLNFWATWCESCQEEMPALEDLHRRLRGRGLVILAPSMDEKGRQAVLPFVARFNLSFPVLLADPRAARDFGVRGLPATYLIGPDGLIRSRSVGPLDLKRLENDILQASQTRRPS